MFNFETDGIRRYRNTHATGDDLQFCVCLHNTNIVKGTEFGSALTEVTLDSGGWQTVTTKKRMNEVADELGLNFRVYQIGYRWYVDAHFPGSGTVRYPFQDGMIFSVYRKHQ